MAPLLVILTMLPMTRQRHVAGPATPARALSVEMPINRASIAGIIRDNSNYMTNAHAGRTIHTNDAHIISWLDSAESAGYRIGPSLEWERTVTVQATFGVRTDIGMVTVVHFSDGTVTRIQRLNSVESCGLPGWHDIEAADMTTSYLHDTKAAAIDVLLSRKNR